MKPILSPAKAGSTNLLETAPRAAFRFTSFRYACPGPNSAAGDDGWLSGSHLKLISFTAIFVILAFLAGCGRTASKSGSPVPKPVSSSLDVVKIKTNNMSIADGGQADATIVLTISTGFHVNANPATFPYLIATKLEVGNGDGSITAGKPVYPVAQTRRFQFAEEPLAVYQDEVNLGLPLRATPKATKGPVSLPISVTVQACDEEKCYPPGRLNAMILVEVK